MTDKAVLLRYLQTGELDPADAEVRRLLQRVFRHPERLNVRSHISAVRLRADGAAGRVRGIASAYGVPYSVAPGLKEVIERGAFTDSIRERPVVPIYGEHAWDLPIGAAHLSDSSAGLMFDGDLFLDTERGKSVYRAAEAGAMTNVSIGFLPDPDGIRREPGLEAITRAAVVEVSLVLMGANPGAKLIKEK